MSVIDPSGMFNGDRLRCCSNAAQLHWPRLFLASDGFGRLEINYARIVGKAYPTFNPIPSETELQSFIQEYARHFLLFLYEFGGQVWGQWDTRNDLLPRYKTAADRRSPIPPEPAYGNWKQRYRAEPKSFPKSFGNISATFLHGVGVGTGEGEGLKACSPSGEQSPDLPHVATPTAQAPVKIRNWGTEEKEAAFEEFWKSWPRKLKKVPAKKAFLKHAHSPETAAKIVQAAKEQIPLLTENGLRYCPYGASWLNDSRFEDESLDTLAPTNEPAVSAAGAVQYRDWKPAWEEDENA